LSSYFAKLAPPKEVYGYSGENDAEESISDKSFRRGFSKKFAIIRISIHADRRKSPVSFLIITRDFVPAMAALPSYHFSITRRFMLFRSWRRRRSEGFS